MTIAEWDDWGYCRPCNRLVRVNDDGIILTHNDSNSAHKSCDGVGLKEWEEPE